MLVILKIIIDFNDDDSDMSDSERDSVSEFDLSTILSFTHFFRKHLIKYFIVVRNKVEYLHKNQNRIIAKLNISFL